MLHASKRLIPGIAVGIALAMFWLIGAAPASAQSTPVPLTLTPATPTRTPTPVPPTVTSTPLPPTSTTTPTPTASANATSTATLIPIATQSASNYVVGTVFEDRNLDGLYSSNEKKKDDVTIRLFQGSGATSSASLKRKTDDKGYYEFKNLLPGTYTVAIEMPDDYFITNPPDRRTVTINNGTFEIVDFAIFKADDAASASATLTTSIYGTSASSGGSSSRGGLVSGGVSGVINGTSVPVATSPPTATPTATPTLTPIQKLKLLPPLKSARFFIEGHANDNGLLYDYVAEGSALDSGEVHMDLTINSNLVDVVAMGNQSYVKPEDSETWNTTSTGGLRNWYGVLSALDVMNLATLDKMVLDVRPTSFVEQIDQEMVRRIDVHLLSQVPTPVTLPATGSSAGANLGVSTTPQPAGITTLYPSVGIQPQLRSDPGGTVTTAPSTASSAMPNQLQVLDGIVELWVGMSDGYVRAAHLRLNMPSTRQDRPGRLEPVALDQWVWYSEINQPFTISSPFNLTPPTPQPALSTAIARATEEARNVAAAPSNGNSPAPIPVPVRSAPSEPPQAGTNPGGQTDAQPEPRPAGTPDTTAAAAERALLALASASGPRTGSKVTETGIQLDVPWRGTTDATGAAIATDGPTSLGMILEAFGVTAPTADLQALSERWQEVRTDGGIVPIETLVRIAERGALRPIGTGRGPGGGDWTALMARDFIRRGYPVLALVRPQLLSNGLIDPQQPDRFIVLIGYEDDELIYHDPVVIDGSARRVDALTLDQAWSQATPPRQGVVFGFGASVIGLLDGPGRSQQIRPEATATATSIVVRMTPTAVVQPVEPLDAPPVETGPPPALLAFLGILAGGVGFLIARLYR